MDLTRLAEALYLKSADSGWYADGSATVARTIVFPRAATPDLAEVIAAVLLLYDSRLHGMVALELGRHELSVCGMVLTIKISRRVQSAPHLRVVEVVQ